MTAMEIALLILGAAAFIASFIVPEIKKDAEEPETADPKEIERLTEEQAEKVRQKVEDTLTGTIEYAVEKTERSLEKLSNEKIMAVNEYSDTVLEAINKNHKEVMFLYDMLNEKQEDVKSTIRVLEQTKNAKPETRQAVKQSPAQSLQDDFLQGIAAKQVKQPATKVLKPAVKKDAAVEISFEAGNEDSRNMNERILNLHQAGKSNVAIAKELGLGVGEVKLVIDLFEGAKE